MENTTSKRLVKNKLNTIQWRILNHMKVYAVGEENALSGNTLANRFDITPALFRHHIARIRKHQEVVIGSSKNKGYYIPLEEEKAQALRYAENKTLSELETRVRQSPTFALKAFRKLNETLKTTDKALQGQMKMLLSGYENELVNYFGDKYLEENE